MITVVEARRRVLEGVAPTAPEWAALADAHGRVLAADLVARHDQPPFPTTAMDGYAFASGQPAYRVAGEARAGEAFAGALGPMEALRVFTGAPLPPGFDTIVPQEDATFDADGLLLAGTAKPGRFLRPAGLDFRAGETVLPAGRVLDPRAIALAAATGAGLLPVRRRPRLGLLATGDELVPVGVRPGPDQIVASSIHAVAGLARAAGAEPIDLGIAADSVPALRERLDAALAADIDVLVTLGGASVGEHDHVKAALGARGMALGFWTIAMRPGKPLVFGTIGDVRVLGMPGNPVSTYVCAKLFLEPLIEALLGRVPGPRFEPATLGADMAANDHREDYVRARLSGTAGAPMAIPFAKQDSSMQSVLAQADCLVVRPANAPPAYAGAMVEILRL